MTLAPRLVDILFATAALVLLSPLFLLVAAAIALDSPGNPFYGGRRVGRNGRMFQMWKFRTMVSNADRIGPGITGREDPRITRLGRFLRKSKIDEFPQFFNLLTGDLTLVGPRPEVSHPPHKINPPPTLAMSMIRWHSLVISSTDI